MASVVGDQPSQILIVEDEEAHAELICRSFEDTNARSYVVTVVTSLREARRSLDNAVPDLVVTDFLLPDGKGIELAQDRRIADRIPLIVMTSHGNEQTAVDAMKAGALDYVVKSHAAFLDMPRTADRTLREWGHITERKRAEEELRESERRFRGIFENDHLVMLIVDPHTGAIEDASPAACTFYGYTSEELRKKKISEITILPPEEVSQRMQKAKSRKRKHFDSRHRLASGEIRDVEVCTGPILVGGRTLLFSVIDDVTEQKRVEDALRQSEERFRTVFESAEECIFIKDRSLRYTHVNPAMCALLGLPASKIVGRRAESLYDEETGRQLVEREARVLAGESIETEQMRVVRGTFMTFHDTLAPLRNSEGSIIGICGISRDVTSRKKLASQSLTVAHDYPSEAMRNTLKQALIAAKTDSIVLLQGESGSGKDFLARWLHDRSKRSSGPFFSINCAALPRELAESELFGHERGAFTGAAGLKKGMLELAEGGTILLNEIGELELPLQSKLLTFLDTQSFLRVGGQKKVQVNARLIAATHRDLQTEVDQGRFLKPLFYRLNVFPIHVPALRDRAEDMPLLVQEIISKLAVEMQLTEIPRISSRHIEVLFQYSWPGNVRELRNVLERSLILWTGGEFNLAVPQVAQDDGEWCYTVRYLPGINLRDVTNSVEASLCSEVLRRCSGNKKEAARLLDISRDTLYRLMKKTERESGS